MASVGVDALVTQSGRPAPPQEYFLATQTSSEAISEASEGQDHTDVPSFADMTETISKMPVQKDVVDFVLSKFQT